MEVVAIKSNILPTSYYTRELGGIPSKQSRSHWISVRCVFHDDHNPSMSVNLNSGGFICHACGAKGGDIIAFEMQRCRLSFKEALTKLSKDWRLE